MSKISSIRLSGVTYDIGSQITIDPSLDSGSTNAVANSAITEGLDAKVNVADNVVDFYEILSEPQSGGYIYPKNVDGNRCKKWYYTTSGISTTTTYEVQNYIIPTTGGSGSFSLIIQLAIDNGVITGYTVTQDTFNALDSASVTNGVMEVKLKDDYYVEIINLQSNNGLYTYNPIYTIKENQSADALNEDIKGILESYWNNIGSSLKGASLSYIPSKGNYIRLYTSSNNGTQETYFQLADGVNMKYVYDGYSDNTISGKLIPIITSSVPSWNSINYNSESTSTRYLPSDYTTTTGNKSKQVTSVRVYVNTATTLSSGSERNVKVYIQSWSGNTAVTTNTFTYNYTTGNTFTADSTTTRTEEASGITHTYSGNVLTVTSTNPDVLIRYIRARVTSPDRAVDNSTDLLTDAEIQTPIKTGQEAYNELDERINALTGGSSCTVQEKLLFENYYRINYGDNQTKVYFTYSGTPTDSSVFYSFNISGTSVDQYANGSVNFGTGGHTANTTGWDTYYSVTWDSANTRFLFAANEGYYIHSMSRPDSHVYFQIPIGTVSGTPCDAVSTLTDGLNAVSSKVQNSLKDAHLNGFENSRKLTYETEKNNGDNTSYNITLKDLKFSSYNVLETDINVGLGTSGWTTFEASDNCSANDLDITKFKAIYGDGITSYTQKALYVNYQFTYNGGSFGGSFSTDFSDDTTVTANTPTTGWSVLYDSVTSAMTVTAPEGEVEYQGSVGTFNITRIDNNNCKFNNGITLQKYGENTTPIRQYVQENRAALGGLSLVKLTQAQYDALATKDSNTLYVING